MSKLLCSFAFNVHDSSVSFAIDNEIILVLEAERVFRTKRKRCDLGEMEHLIKYGLSYLGKDVEDVSSWAMTTLQNPLLSEADIFEHGAHLPKEPYWKRTALLGKERDVFIVNHHLSHAATYLTTDFDDATIITCDGGGDYNSKLKTSECVAAYKGKGDNIERIQIDLSQSLTAKFYGACSFFLYNEIHSEGKMMAFAACGTPNKNDVIKLKEIATDLGTLHYQASIRLFEDAFPDAKGGALTFSKTARDFAAAAQKVFSDKRIEDVAHILQSQDNNSNNLVMAGGACLNLDVNTVIYEHFPELNHFIAPCCDDTGQSLGALCLLIAQVMHTRPKVKFPYLGMGKKITKYSDETIEKAVAVLLQDGVVILHNGQAEIGPRALGNRSFIARPDKITVKEALSEEIKRREEYRPVAPVVLEDKMRDYFAGGPSSSPFMLYKYDVVSTQLEQIAGAVHRDGSARAQTITKQTNPFLYDLIKKFGDKTGVYMLLNTSLNLKGDPIANTIDDSVQIYENIRNPKILIRDGEIWS